jgi:PHD/YefM family antitoxin component YafN of YafNO toxin-antitoxin module
MAETKNIEEASDWPEVLMDNLEVPVILEQEGQPKAVLMSLKDYQHYQALLARQEYISAREAHRAANRAVFGDLVGCPLSCGEPVWAPQPQPRWRVPYHLFNGTLMAIVEVDGYTGVVYLTEQERTALLEKVRQAVTADAPS